MTEQPTAPPPAYPPPPAPVAAEPRRGFHPGASFWYAGAAAATIVLVACAGFLVGRASVDHDGGAPTQIQHPLPESGSGPQFGVPPGGMQPPG